MEAIKEELENMGLRCTIEEHSAVIIVTEKRTGQNATVKFDYDGTPRGFVAALAEYAENYDPGKEADARVAMHYIMNWKVLHGVSDVVDDARETKGILKNAARRAMAAVMKEEEKNAIKGKTFYLDVFEQFDQKDDRFYEKKPLPDGVKRYSWQYYNVGDIVYTELGTKFRILYIGEEGYDTYIEYMEGPRTGLITYMHEVQYLYK